MFKSTKNKPTKTGSKSAKKLTKKSVHSPRSLSLKKPALKTYDPSKIESKWQKKWQSSEIYSSKEDNKKEKYYVLDMFPYPSGEGLHVGHPKGYIATDIISRYKRMKGYSVLHPMGFDAFGLPAENYALKTRTNPSDSVKKNVARYKKQLEIMGFDYDWSREINTTDPAYYKWTQWIFLQLLKKGLAYQSFEPINWCPSCKTGLANEDVEDGHCERCGTVVEKKPIRQWVLKITDYAQRLLNDLEFKKSDGKLLLDWPESIKTSQRNWIGRSEGAIIKFKSQISNFKTESQKEIEVFTTRPDTLFGVTYLVLAPEHKLVNEFLKFVENKAEVEAYISRTKEETEIQRTDAKKEKTGVELKGIKVINPANNEEVPVWIADYVLADYGTGAVMAVPAHDERDWDFAKKFGLPIKRVIEPKFVGTNGESAPKPGLPYIKREAVCAVVRNPKDGTYLCNSWKKFKMNGLFTGGIEAGEDIVETAKREVLEETGYKNLKLVRKSSVAINTFFYHRIKQQNRHAHFQFVFFELENDEREAVAKEESDMHEIVWKKRDELKDFFTVFEGDFIVNILDNDDYAHIDPGLVINSGSFNGRDSDLIKKEITEFVGGKWVTKFKLRDWVFSRQRYWGEPIPVIHCPHCAKINSASQGVVPVPEKDLPVVLPRVKSYEPTGTGESPLAAIEKWVNVKCPVCKGPAKRETNTMPQWAGSSWYYLRYMDPKNKKALVDPKKEKYWAPVDTYVGGAEHATRHLIYARFWHKFLYDQGLVSTVEPFTKLQHVGLIMGEDGRKMSKRFGNVINPDDIVKAYGADTLRLYEMFMGPFDQQIAWSTSSIVGTRRFIEKVWKLREKVVLRGQASQSEVQRTINKTIKKVTEDIENMRYNTAISSLMIAVNELEKAQTLSRTDYESLLKLIAPFAPHFTEEIWTNLGNKKSIHISAWPIYDPALSVADEVKIMVQVNGKIRGSFMASVGATNEELEKSAQEVSEVKKWLEGKKVLKVIAIPHKMVSLVVKD